MALNFDSATPSQTAEKDEEADSIPKSGISVSLSKLYSSRMIKLFDILPSLLL